MEDPVSGADPSRRTTGGVPRSPQGASRPSPQADQAEERSLDLVQRMVISALIIVVFGLFALGFGLAAAAAALALVLPMWASLLIVCGALVLLAAILLFAGLGAIKKGAPPVPEQAIREAKLTTEALRNGRS